MTSPTVPAITWEAVPAISRVAFVGRIDGRAVGVVEWDGYGYRAVTCDGVILGSFAQVEQAQLVLRDQVVG